MEDISQSGESLLILREQYNGSLDEAFAASTLNPTFPMVITEKQTRFGTNDAGRKTHED